MSFAPQMHGSFFSQSCPSDTSFMELSVETEKKIATLQAKLNKKLGPEYISQRPGPGGGQKLTYAEGWKIINLANEVFGFNGWSSSVVNMTTDFIDFSEDSKRFSVGVTAIVRVTLRDGVFHEDVGYGLLENSKSKGAALDKCKKEAVTDAIKRTLRNFGNLLGNCLYDKSYTQEVVKIKVPPPKFNKNELHRRPEFEDVRPAANASAPNGPSNALHTSIKSEPTSEISPRMAAILSATSSDSPAENKAESAVPQRMRSVSASNGSGITVPTPVFKEKTYPGQSKTGLNTPIQTLGNAQVSRTIGADQAQPRLQQSRVSKEDPNRSNAERRVSFAPQTAVVPSAAQESSSTGVRSLHYAAPEPLAEAVITDDGEESFHFPSDDDAFLAALQFEEDGLGRPIDFEVDEEVNGSCVDLEGQDVLQRQSTGGNAPLPQLKQQASVNSQHHVPPSCLERGKNPSVISSLKRKSPILQDRNASSKNLQAGSSVSCVPAITTVDNSSRSSTSSLGGFHSPPGVDPQSLRPIPPPPPRASTGQAPTIGLKRSADVMHAQSAQPLRRHVQGMGLAPHAGGQKRDPLSNLEVGEGGAVKRPRR
ncbi:uncharacterized protein FIBRA_05397 [Fibroporia radiculosa]|uniref:Uncharacterized protein n=1 Tax=Fibroporia radiculosa TaxID=599839 RepID=J4H3H2_9APHY|nr:uncharacterized protein FIBRA_05397 [Fibroporia radiculosa]CCM03269.1 predicted protein [Fibroporia radiculosa]